MANTQAFGSLMVALLESPYWLTKEFREHFKITNTVDAAVVQGKRILHFAYDLSNGRISKNRIAWNLSLAKAHALKSSATSSFDFHHFAGSLDQSDQMSVTLSQVLLAFDAETHFSGTYDIDSCASAAAVSHASEDVLVSFFDTPAYNVDAFGRLLRVAVNTVCCIQRLHLVILKNQKTMNHAMLPKFTRTYSVKKKKLRASDYDEIWRNYVFDIAASWMVIQRFYASCQNGNQKEMIHALHKSRIWSLTTGIAGSSVQMKMIEKHQISTLDKIARLGLFLHDILLRLWPIGLNALHTKSNGSTKAVERAIGRISASVFVRSTEDVKTDVPECGTATIVDNYWTYTMLRNSQLGIMDGHIGSRVEDLNHSVYAGALSDAITRTTSHLWAAAVSHQVWTQLDVGLPELAEIDERMMPLLDQNDLTLEDLNQQGLSFRRSFFKNREKEENDEIEGIISRVN
jgi:hypothetical protein